MHADKEVAEKITAYVGEIIGIITKKSNPEIKSKAMSQQTVDK